MLKLKLLSLYYALKIATCSCQGEESRGFQNIRSDSDIQSIALIDNTVNESSGLIKAREGGYWTNNDSGGKSEIYRISEKGELLETRKITGTSNIDWEELASDKEGNIYIGDFGNNRMNRKDLKVYKIGRDKTEIINFSYADQAEFPSSDKNFDCEAFFWFQGNLHLFTKSWSKDNLITKHYILSDQAGTYVIKPLEKLEVKETVTAADVSPDGNTFALLTYGKILIFKINNESISLQEPLACIKTRRKQTEAIVFKSENELLFSNEQGSLYSIDFHLP